MKGFPPAVLVDTWLLLANSKDPEDKIVKLVNNRKIKQFFGSMEIAQLYIEQNGATN